MDDYTDPALYVVGLPRLRALLEPVIVRYVMHLPCIIQRCERAQIGILIRSALVEVD